MNNTLFLQSLINANVKFVLWGSEAGVLHNCNIVSSKDIDLLIENSEQNIRNLYNCLSQFFTISYDDIFTNDTIGIKTKDQKCFDIKKERYYIAEQWLCCYDSIITDSKIMSFLNCDINVISKQNYLKIIQFTLNNTDYPVTKTKKQRFEQILKST